MSGAEGYRVRWKRKGARGRYEELRVGKEPPIRPTLPEYVIRHLDPRNTYMMKVVAILPGEERLLGEEFEVAPGAYASSKVQAVPIGDADIKVEWEKPAADCGYRVQWCPVKRLNADGSCADDWDLPGEGYHPPLRRNGWGALDVSKYKTEARIGGRLEFVLVDDGKGGYRKLAKSPTGDPSYNSLYKVQVWGLPTHTWKQEFLIGETEVRTLDSLYLFPGEIVPQEPPLQQRGEPGAVEGPEELTAPGPVALVALSVADARAREGTDATIAFAVTLDRASPDPVTVRYATKNGTAKAGKDYRRARGKLVFAVGETEKTISVRVLDDAHYEGEETFTLRLRRAKGAVVADGKAVGTIVNSDPMPRAKLSLKSGASEAATDTSRARARAAVPTEPPGVISPPPPEPEPEPAECDPSGFECSNVEDLLERDECKALVALYEAACEEEWDWTDRDPDPPDETRWFTPTPEYWVGITLDGKHVRELALDGRNLSGEIPPEIGNLTELESLDLSGNGLSGEIPDELEDLANLERLDLSDNKELSGDLPRERGELSELDISCSGISEPEWSNEVKFRRGCPVETEPETETGSSD